MDDIKPFVFVQVDGEDCLEDEIEVNEKSALITLNGPAQCTDPENTEKQTRKRRRRKNLILSCKKHRSKPQSGDEQVGASESIISNNSNHSDLQITNVASKAECFFNSENNNDSESTTYLRSEDPSVALDPLQNYCDLKTNKNVRVKPVTGIQIIIPTSKKKKNFNSLETDIKVFTPYIRKLCGSCKRVTELLNNSVTDNRCNLCKKPVTYCCKLCLEISSLKEMYIHIFKCHYDIETSSEIRIKNKPISYALCSKCGVHYVNAMKLKEHEEACNALPNLFCKFCPSKLRIKREMREHMIEVHSQQFQMKLLEKMLNEIVEEGDTVMSMLTQHRGSCSTCQKRVALPTSLTHCAICSTKLIYHCNDPGCSSLVFAEQTSLQTHLRQHMTTGWTKKHSSTKAVCHLCGYEDDRVKLKIHMQTKHSDIFLCKCDLCGVSLKNISAWKRHQADYCPVTHQKLQCEHCWFMSFKKKRMRRHLKTVHTHVYTGKRPQCNKCGITWAGLYRLRWHMSRCSGNFKIERAKQKELWAMRGVVTLS